MRSTKKCLLAVLGLPLFLLSFWHAPALAKTRKTLKIAYFSQDSIAAPALSNPDPFIPDKGIPGTQLGIDDTNTTGQFTGQTFTLKTIAVAVNGDAQQVFLEQVAGKFDFVVANVPADTLLKLADLPAAKKMLLFNIASSDDVLRNQECRSNILHVAPSRSMRTDALAQYMVQKRWSKWLLVVGQQPEDRLFAEALKKSAKRYHLEIIDERVWEHSYEAGRSAQSDVAVFTQADEYDLLVVADERGAFGEYLDYRTWLPRPVMGTQGLIATSWHRTHEQWGAIQMQNRFKEKAKRWMEEQDYAGYLAVRALGEAATRTQSTELAPIKTYLLGEQFALQGYKGNPLSFRPWDGQLRQPLLLAAPRSLVAVAPIEGFLHPKTELDTLGHDQPESQCHWENP